MKQSLIVFAKTHKELCFFVLFVILSGLLSQCGNPSQAESSPMADEPSALSTLIPKGHALVPLEIANYQTLDSIFGSFGIVDLYVQDATAKNYSRFVAKNIKLVRAPKNPSHFAALVLEQEIPRLMSVPGPFFAVVQNSSASGTQFEKGKQRSRSRIHYNLGD